MDKETLSNYGWIVICVLVLAVMLSLASPFGKFVSTAVQSTTQGLFGVNQEALGAAGITIDNQAFCDHENITTVPAASATEEHPAHDAYTVCDDCGKTLTEDGEIPYQYNAFTITHSGRTMMGFSDEMSEFTIPETFYYANRWYKVTAIGERAFTNCENLTSITIPNSVVSIGEYAFFNLSNLSNVVIPDSVTSIGNTAFSNCTSLTSINIPNSVTSIGNSAFSNTALSSITIPNSVTSIGESAFYKCTSLTSVIIPDSVTSIGNGAFYGCTALTAIAIPNSITSIEGTFYNCTNLTTVEIPNSLTSIGKSTFVHCENLTSIVFNGTTEQWDEISKYTEESKNSNWWNGWCDAYTVHCTNGHLKKVGFWPTTDTIVDNTSCPGDTCPLR